MLYERNNINHNILDGLYSSIMCKITVIVQILALSHNFEYGDPQDVFF